MPCYTEWDAYLEKGSREYEEKKAELEAKLKAVKHILDYYYGIEGQRVPPARYTGHQTWLEMAHQEFEVDKAGLLGIDEKQILKNVVHHCMCDGIRFTLIYDLVSLLDIHNKADAGYARIMLACANDIRSNKYRYRL